MCDAAKFLTGLFDYWPDPDLRVEIRCLPPRQKSDDGWPRVGPRKWYPLTSIQQAATDALGWSNRFDVYVGVLPRQGEGGKASDVYYADWLWTDIDGGDEGPEGAIALAKKVSLPRPNIAVLSGGGLHLYWRLSDHPTFCSDTDRRNYKDTLRRLVMAIGGTPPAASADIHAAEVARVMRIPGTINQKRGKRVQLLRMELNSDVHSYDWWRANLPTLPAPVYKTNPDRKPHAFDGSIPSWAEKYAHEPISEGSRHTQLVRFASRLVRDLGVPRDRIRELLETKAAVSPGDPIPPTEIEGILRWA